MPTNTTARTAAIAAFAVLAAPQLLVAGIGPSHTDIPAIATTDIPVRHHGTLHPANSHIRPAPPAPYGRWDSRQMTVAHAIVDEGKRRSMPRRAWVIAVATAMQESKLLVLANPAVPESTRLPHHGLGHDDKSIGVFQQIPRWWGTPSQLMDTRIAAGKFYAALTEVQGWQHMPLTVAAQAVQGSAYPNAYAQWEDDATAVVNHLTN